MLSWRGLTWRRLSATRGNGGNQLRSTYNILGLFDLLAGSPDLLNVTDLAIDALPAEDGRTVLRIALEMAALRPPAEEADMDAEMSAGTDPARPAPARSLGIDTGPRRCRTVAPGPISALYAAGPTRGGPATSP